MAAHPEPGRMTGKMTGKSGTRGSQASADPPEHVQSDADVPREQDALEGRRLGMIFGDGS